jgi:Benzoate membrane transport protein.
MLAGVLLKFGISVFGSLQQSWSFVLTVLAIYLISKK